MKYALRIRPNAEEDLRQAYAWYEEQRVGLGDDFLLCYEAALDAIIENPTRFPIIQHKIRRTLIRRFPYAIYYVFDPKTISILAVFHGKRQRKGLLKERSN